MTEQITAILRRLEQLETEVAELKGDKSAAEKFARLAPDETVGADYVAWRFGISLRAVRRGEHGTKNLRCSKKGETLRFKKRVVDAAWRERSKTPAERAAEERAKANVRRPGSIIKKTA